MMVNDDLEKWLERAREHESNGLDWFQAKGIAWLEERILKWPADWGDNLEVLIFGDFEPPAEPLFVPSLGITVLPEKQENTAIKGATCVLKAIVQMSEKSVPALIEAGRRINVLLGAYTLVEWGNAGSGWWSYVTHGTGGGVGTKLAHDDMPRAIEGILKLRPVIRKKVDAALYWIREPKNLLMEFHRNDVLRVYSSYWNAFECLVEAVISVRPMPKMDRNTKQKLLDEFVESCGDKLTPSNVQQCYQQIVNPGFVGKATHALRVCFNNQADHYINECFRLPDKHNRLYDIRNSINHGDIDAENPEELLRVESRLHELWMIIWRMFSLLVPFSAPLNSKTK
jgi:hypothetical protein